MIILDYSGVAISNILVQNADTDENLIRHTILNAIRAHNKKFRDEYGQMVIACDGGSVWRREYFPNYKYRRRAAREEGKGPNWNEIYRVMGLVIDDLKENFPFKVVKVQGAEADDIIATLTIRSQEFGHNEPIMIVSTDKDFIQLQKFPNVKQYSPTLKKFVQESNPRTYLFEHIFKGDSGDGVPNILSPDNTFVDSIRQSPVTKKKIESWISSIDNLESVLDSETYRNFQRNKKMIDLTEIPESVVNEIINTYEQTKPAHKTKILNYLIKNRCKMLIECVGDFY